MLRILFIWCALLIGSRAVVAQSRYTFFTLGVEQGLTGPEAWGIAQDKYGLMWIGTVNGLNRYDGHSVRQYRHSDKDSFSLPGNRVVFINKDRDGDLWISCGHAGVARYNYALDRFERLPAYEQWRARTGRHAPVWRTYEDPEGRLYLNCGGALLRYDKRKDTIGDLTPLFNGAIDDVGVGQVVHQNPDRVWVLTDNGLYFFDRRSGTIRPVPFDREGMGYGAAGMHHAVFINPEELLITMARPGFVIFNTRTWQFRSAPAPFNPSVNKKFNACGGVLRDSRGRFWLANSLYGLVEYDPATNRITTMKSEQSYPYPHPEQEGLGMSVYEDRDGNIWYGTSLRGMVWFQPGEDHITVYRRDYSNPRSLPDNRINGFLPATGGGMYVATGKNLVRVETDGSLHHYPFSINRQGHYPSMDARLFDRWGDTVYISTANGLSLLNERTGRFSRFVRPENTTDPFALFDDFPRRVVASGPGEVILVGNFAARFDLRTGKCYRQENSGTADPLYAYRDIHAAAVDRPRHCLWVENGGELSAYDFRTHTKSVHRFTRDTSIRTLRFIRPDPSGALWLMSKRHLIRYEPETGRSETLGLPVMEGEPGNFIVGDPAYLWITTATEIIRVDRRSGSSQILNLQASIPNATIHRHAAWLDASLRLWVGTDAGFCILDTRRLPQAERPRAPQLVAFDVFDRPKVFDQPFHHLRAIELSYRENFFAFSFSALDYSHAAQIRYAYMLEGFDKDWKVDHAHRATYTNVPPGNYLLRLKAIYSSGEAVEAEPVKLVVAAPFWSTWWFYALMALLFALAIWGLLLWYRKWRLRRQMDETVDYFANSLYGENSVSEICWDIARNCIAQLRLEDCVVYLLDEQRNVLVQKAVYGPKNPRDHEILNPIEIRMGEGIVGAAAASGKPVLVRDTRQDGRYIVDDALRLSELAVPIIHEGKAIGVIDSEHPRRNFFRDEHVKVLSTIAAISASKITEAKAEAMAREREVQLLEIRKLLAESQLMALRAQMNPHFVFNCLNSIQECIVTEKYGEASLYLNKFAKLFRQVLNNSGKVMVTLAEEVEVLRLYLALEHMRFEQSFRYEIEVDEELEEDEILIPSMLLQPYVENALWHGLMHKAGERELRIRFARLSEEAFQCEIDDNGIGRKRALELREEQSKTKRHVSRGMSISKDRVELLQKQGQHASLEIIDKYDNDTASGTRVRIELSTYLKTT